MLRIAARIYEAAISPDAWPAALQSVAEASGATGASCRIWNRHTGQIEWVTMSSGFPAQVAADYLRHFAPLDLFAPLLADNPCGRWLRLSECVAPEVLRRDEWYCDYVVRNGVVDISGNRLFEAGCRTFLFSIQDGIGRQPLQPDRLPALQRLMTPLAQAARLTVELRGLRAATGAAGLAIEQLGAAIIVCDGEARILEVNRLAERLLTPGEMLTVRDGRLSARRVFETGRLEALIAAAAGVRGEISGGRMLLGSVLGTAPLVATVMPLVAEHSPSGRPAAMVLIGGGTSDTAFDEQIAKLFGLSRAETRLAAALVRGRTLGEVAADRGLKITTVRTQLSSILRKLGIHRQTDLVRLLASVPAAKPLVPELVEHR